VQMVSRWQRSAVNRKLGIGLAVFIVVYIVATICFIMLE
jgi:hypothetical protein